MNELAYTLTFLIALSRRVSPNGSTMSRVVLMLLLQEWGKPVSMTALAKALDSSCAGMTSLTDTMEADGWVERTAHPTDRRQKLVFLTPKGLSAVRGEEVVE